MPWTYSQSTGQLTHNGVVVGSGYSGRGAGKNNPGMQNRANLGPIPQGRYTISAPFEHPHAGHYVMRLTPQTGTNTFGRNGLLMHGDSPRHPGRASDGCIIQDNAARRQVGSSGDRTLEVVR